MSKNHNLLYKSKVINKYFKSASQIDIYDSHTMTYYMKSTWDDLSLEDLEIMGKTLEIEINNKNSIHSFFDSINSVVITLFVGFLGAFIAIVVSDQNNEIEKSLALKLVGFVVIGFLGIMVIDIIINIYIIRRRINRSQNIIRILIDLKESEQKLLD